MFEQTAEKIKNAKIIPVAKVQEKEEDTIYKLEEAFQKKKNR